MSFYCQFPSSLILPFESGAREFLPGRRRFTGSIEGQFALLPPLLASSIPIQQKLLGRGKIRSLIRIHGRRAPICLVKGTLLG